MFQRPVNADQIKAALAKRHKKDSFFTEVRNGPGNYEHELLIMDAVAFRGTWSYPWITGYEIKTSRGDFLGDEKWRGYLKYCNELCFVCPRGVIEPNELPEDIGLIYYNPQKDSLWTSRRGGYREIDQPVDMMRHLIMRWDKQEHPFYSSKVEYFKDYVADKANKSELGFRVSEKMRKQLREAEDMERHAQRELAKIQRTTDFVQKVRQMVYEVTGKQYFYLENLEDALELAIGSGPTYAVERTIERIETELGKLKETLGVK